MQDSKKGSLPMLHSINLSKTQSPSTQEERDRMIKNILKYLRRTKEMFLVYEGEEELVVRGAMSWKSSKQETIADSTTEAEYIAASNAAKETVWIKKFITELVVVSSIADPVELYCDNNGAIAQAKEPKGDMKICRIPTDENLADPLTKSLVQRKHEAHTRSLGIKDMSDWL
ncbi:hypothetical protein CRG98_000981 [Punica granatum]|uniref:Reverse transcriptase Ty1/copia-type domain-containing protein n=1 Tax=Punica granatum TaxID=22663 RepID=A0A2I0LD54_PUNGR|nr:hypothetical protein CRG98_000981 [Punica granatum]